MYPTSILCVTCECVVAHINPYQFIGCDIRTRSLVVYSIIGSGNNGVAVVDLLPSLGVVSVGAKNLGQLVQLSSLGDSQNSESELRKR